MDSDQINNDKKVYYSLDRPHPSLNSLPPGVKCRLCQCDRNAHLIYHFCPLFNDWICIKCSQEEIKDPANFTEIQKILPNITKEEINTTCERCGNS